MAIYYLDTSALVKRYINEPGSAFIRQLCNARTIENQPAHVFITSHLAMVEVAAAFAILERRKLILKGTAMYAFQQFIDDWDTTYRLGETTISAIKSATALAQRYPLKAYDAVHLAVALEAQKELVANMLELSLVSGDEQILQAAQREGLAVENPFTYAHLDK